MKPVLVFDKVNARVLAEDDSFNVFYTVDTENPDNDCPDDVVEVVVQMYNEGKDLYEIDDYLLYADCTQDAREIMVESLFHVYYPNSYVMLGDFTFLDPIQDGEHKVIINRIDEVKAFVTIEQAEKYGEEQLDNFEGYLVPQSYNGKISF